MDIVEFAEKVLGIELWPHQKELLRALQRGEKVKFGTRWSRNTFESILCKFRCHEWKEAGGENLL